MKPVCVLIYIQERPWHRRARRRLLSATGQRYGVSILSAISPPGDLRFMTAGGRMNAGRFIEVLKWLVHSAERAIFLIIDGHPSHRERRVFGFVRGTERKLRLFFLPPYSPELNPEALAWNYLKNHGVGKRIVKSRDESKQVVMGHLHSLQKTPDLIRALVHGSHLRYVIA